jgi:hypothetical protein
MSEPEDDPQFLAELERRIEDIKLHGDFVRTQVIDGVIYKQTYRNHQPHGEPVAWRAMPKEKP